jgi:hypothetical protein
MEMPIHAVADIHSRTDTVSSEIIASSETAVRKMIDGRAFLYVENKHGYQSDVPYQREVDIHDRPILDDAEADTPCQELGVDGILNRCNHIFHTTYSKATFQPLFQSFIDEKYDFGTAFALLRPWWPSIAILQLKLTSQKLASLIVPQM